MKPSEIQVGKFYLRHDYPDSRYLGVGKRKPWTYGATMEFTEKSIVCIKSEEILGQDYALGLVFKTPEDEQGASLEDWELFYLDPWQNS